MILLVATVFASSLVGSVHCAAMCGGLSCLASQGGKPSLQAGYHLGRLAVYVVLGAIAGFLGHGIDSLAAVFDVERAALVLMVAVVALTAGMQLVRLPRVNALVGRALRRVAPASTAPMLRAVALGVATGLIPCGWLYAFVGIAAATASVRDGISVMAAFAIGGAPALIGSAQLAAYIARTWLGRNRRAALALVLATCAVTLVVRGRALSHIHSTLERTPEQAELTICHGVVP